MCTFSQLRAVEILDALKVSSKLDFGRSVSAVYEPLVLDLLTYRLCIILNYCKMCLRRSYYTRSIHFPTRLFMLAAPLLSLIGQFLSSYGYWGYCSSDPSHLWFPLTVAVTAFALYAWVAAYRFVHSLQVCAPRALIKRFTHALMFLFLHANV